MQSSSAVRLAVFYAAFFTVVGVLQPFWPLWLAGRRLDAAEIGLVLALGVGAKVIGLPIAAHLADRSGERQRLMLALALASALTFMLFGPSTQFWQIVLVSLLFFSLWPPIMSLGESLTLQAAQADGFEYGRIRLWGSITFIAAALVAGGVLARAPVDAVFWMILGGVMLTAVACAALPDLRTERAPSLRLPVIAALRQRPFLRMLIACGLIQGSHAVYYGFATLHWQRIGFGEDLIGVLWAEGVVCEVVLFAFGSPLVRRCGAGGLIRLAGAAAALRWFTTGLTDALPALVVMQALHAFSFGAAHLGAMHWIGRHVPPGRSATAQSLYAAVVWGLFLGATFYAAGWLYESFGRGAYLAMAALAFAGAACAARPADPA